MKNYIETETGEIIVPRDCLRGWAAKNAYTLIFLTTFFSITWIVIIVAVAING